MERIEALETALNNQALELTSFRTELDTQRKKTAELRELLKLLLNNSKDAFAKVDEDIKKLKEINNRVEEEEK